MELFVKIASFVQGLSKKDFDKYLIICLVGITLIAGGISFYIYNKSSELILNIKQFETLAQKSMQILRDNQRMQQQEERFKLMVEKNPDFTINGFFEQFCRDLAITPETGWAARTDQINEKMDELTIPATFKGQTTEKLVAVLEALEKKEMVYTKDLRIRNEANKKIAFDITIATNRYRTGTED